MKRALILLLLAGCSEPKAQAEATPSCYTITSPTGIVYLNVREFTTDDNGYRIGSIGFTTEKGMDVRIFGGATMEFHSCN